MSGTPGEILGLIAARRERRAVRDLPALAELFRRLGACASVEATDTEDRIWGVWMHHPHRAAAAALDAATRDIAARRYDIAETRVALASADFEQLRQLGHRMKGVGNSYGFNHVSTLGKYIEDGARSGDRAGLQARIAEYAEYLSKVKIVYE